MIRFSPHKSIIVLFLFLSFPIFSNEESCPKDFSNLYEKSWKGDIRLKALRSLDKMLHWSLNAKNSDYVLTIPLKQKTFETSSERLIQFAQTCGYFSQEHPLVGLVTKKKDDLFLTRCILASIHLQVPNQEERLLATAEILTKVLAYRELKQGMEISIPTSDSLGKPVFTSYVVNAVFNLWHGMPAFGLVAKEDDAAPILLFRGTDFSFITKKGWASMISDLDTSGPGLSVFLKSRQALHDWLAKATQKTKARLMGFSLGGVLASYTLIYESEFLTRNTWEPSLIFNPPGVSKEVFAEWEKMPDRTKFPFFVFVTRGDYVSKLGKLIGNVREFYIDESLYPIAAHVTLMTAEPVYHISWVDLAQENTSRLVSSELDWLIDGSISELMFDLQ